MMHLHQYKGNGATVLARMSLLGYAGNTDQRISYRENAWDCHSPRLFTGGRQFPMNPSARDLTLHRWPV